MPGAPFVGAEAAESVKVPAGTDPPWNGRATTESSSCCGSPGGSCDDRWLVNQQALQRKTRATAWWHHQVCQFDSGSLAETEEIRGGIQPVLLSDGLECLRKRAHLVVEAKV